MEAGSAEKARVQEDRCEQGQRRGQSRCCYPWECQGAE